MKHLHFGGTSLIQCQNDTAGRPEPYLNEKLGLAIPECEVGSNFWEEIGLSNTFMGMGSNFLVKIGLSNTMR